MPPDRYRTPIGVGAQHAGPRTAHVDLLLRFLIARCVAATGSVAGRLDAIERTIASLTHQWRAHDAVAPARELRASPETVQSLLDWLEQAGEPDAGTIERLAVYASGAVTDRTVPEGWIRVHLP